ncbi:MAG: hypothetical protein JXR96_09980 [Deltaproteobacteria bacterium]|nr:hypothetical protein [Deltaproteobacteria bacterium]
MRHFQARFRTKWLLALTFFAFSPSAWPGEKTPVLAVFQLEVKGVELAPEALDRLSDFLLSALAESGGFQVIPRARIQERLLEQKKESYRACYDQACQIEIGRELAAECALSAKIIKLGRRCAFTATLFDLRTAASVKAVTEEGECSEEAIVGLLRNAVQRLVISPAHRTREIRVDSGSQPQGRTSTRLPAEDLAEQKKTGTEWIGLEPAFGFATTTAVTEFLGGVSLRAVNLKWKYVSWNVLDAGLVYGLGMFFHVGSRLGYPLHLDERGEHQLQLSLGAAFGSGELDSHKFWGFFVAPGVRYTYHTDCGFFLGIGLHAFFPAEPMNAELGYPVSAMLTVPIGWSS